MFVRLLFSAPGCGWSECRDPVHFHALQAAISLDPVKHEGWRLLIVEEFIPHAAVMIAPVQ